MMKETRLPTEFVYTVVAISILPFLLNLVGISFASLQPPLNPSTLLDLSASQLFDTLHHSLFGSFTHTTLEWIAISTAFLTGALSFAHFAIKRDVVTPIIGVALLFAGSMDAFHILVADRMIEGVTNNENLVPFTWAICRLFNVVILIVGVGTVLIIKPQNGRGNFKIVAFAIISFGLLALATILFVMNSPILPTTIFPDQLIKRPWDLMLLVLFMFAGAVVFPQFYERYPSLFSYSLVVSTIPAVITQVHMSFGSTELFDNDFNVGHFLKIICYLVPFMGLILDYVQTYRQEAMVIKTLANSSTLLAKTLEHQEQMAIQQSAAVNQTTNTMNDLGNFSQKSAQQAQVAADTAKQVLNLAEIGKNAVSNTLADMANLKEKVGAISKQIMRLSDQTTLIGNITLAVTDLANQTNLLALNASIEAVRSGENGKGFEVVAKEIRQLADQSKKYSQEINSLATDIKAAINSTVKVNAQGSETVDQGVKNAQFTADTFLKVAKEINSIVLSSQEIYFQYKQQEIAIQQVIDSMNFLNDGVAHTATGISETKLGLQDVEKALLLLVET
ncbi:methyl-accepting chemotaxis protein [Ancylothrix sp. C2]|uniref:methyl-accepting chemotaxis protein n=1 Tax=Ancylothrix sp. D3o TaxID=2953691 RepID=UPI0021BACA6F|nr:methyl-accepting chemotaxis protein [Ancylothrix sp. D3o]MCT7952501.1 methyl-accepting chemotaxis protein [Ancylothrix sp. D3o]